MSEPGLIAAADWLADEWQENRPICPHDSALGFPAPAPFHRPVAEIVVISANDTNAGKTVLTVALARWLYAAGRRFRALKPLCSGGRADAEEIAAAQGGAWPLDEINPWHFGPALAPSIAAQQAGQRISLEQIAGFVRRHAAQTDLVIVEAAGGLLSPFASDGDALDLIEMLDARPILVCQNKLGAINQALLLWKAMPAKVSAKARLVLMAQANPDTSSEGNTSFLRDRLGAEAVVEFPYLSDPPTRSPLNRAATDALERLCP